MKNYAVIIVTTKDAEKLYLFASTDREILNYIRMCQKHHNIYVEYTILHFQNVDEASRYLEKHLNIKGVR